MQKKLIAIKSAGRGSMRAVIYARLSPTTKKAGDSGLHVGIERQIDGCKKALLAQNDDLVKVYIDEFVSGKSHEYMANFNEMIKAADTFDVVYCLKVDRFGRNFKEGVATIQELEAKGKFIHFVQENARTDSMFGRLVVNVLLSVSEWVREDILRKTAEGREKAKLEGRLGRPEKKIDRAELVKLLKIPGMKKRRIAELLGVSLSRLYIEMKDMKIVEYKE